MNSKTILLVEDNPDDVCLTLRAFKKANICNPVVVVRDGPDALDYMFGSGKWAGRDVNEKPALILLDLNLPKVSGVEVLRRLREDDRTRLCQVVVITTSREQRDVVASYELGANSYICKPVDFGQFAAAAQQIGLYWLVLNEPVPEGVK